MLKMTKIHTSTWVILGAFAKTVNLAALMIPGHTTPRPSSEDNSKESGPRALPCEGVRKAWETTQRHAGGEPASQGQALPHAQRRATAFLHPDLICRTKHAPEVQTRGPPRARLQKRNFRPKWRLSEPTPGGTKGGPIRRVPSGGAMRGSLEGGETAGDHLP